MQDKFTEQARAALQVATETAYELSHNYVGTEHLLIGLLGVDGVAGQVLEENGVDGGRILEMVNRLIASGGTAAVASEDAMTPRAKRILEQAYRESVRLGAQLIGTEHILIALLKEPDCIAVRLLSTVGVNIQKVYIDILTAIGQDVNTAKGEYMSQKNRNRHRSSTPVLDQYSRDLTAYARDGKLDPVIGREQEIQRVIQIMSRRTKNNPCLIGEPGVGKTAVAEGLAAKIVEGNVPDTIRDKRVVTLDISGMVAGAKYRGECEERIKRVMQEGMND